MFLWTVLCFRIIIIIIINSSPRPDTFRNWILFDNYESYENNTETKEFISSLKNIANEEDKKVKYIEKK